MSSTNRPISKRPINQDLVIENFETQITELKESLEEEKAKTKIAIKKVIRLKKEVATLQADNKKIMQKIENNKEAKRVAKTKLEKLFEESNKKVSILEEETVELRQKVQRIEQPTPPSEIYQLHFSDPPGIITGCKGAHCIDCRMFIPFGKFPKLNRIISKFKNHKCSSQHNLVALIRNATADGASW